MQISDSKMVFSASDLTGFLACRHLTQLDLKVLDGQLARPYRHDPLLSVISRLGDEHETRYLEELEASGLSVVRIRFPERGEGELVAAAQETRAALLAGHDVVYQATFFDGKWRGHADFLRRVDTPSKLGDYSYEVYDTKLARRAKAAAVLQLCFYADQLTGLQGVEPELLHLVLGDRSVQTFKLRDYSAYYRAVKREFLASIGASPLSTYPDPVDHCRICKWAARCNGQRREDRHLSNVAGMRRDQIKKLAPNGITTIDELAAAAPDRPLDGISTSAFEKLQDQAAMQVESERLGVAAYKLLPPAGEGLGFQTLPEPAKGDVFFDIESDPYAAESGLEYLFGWIDALDGFSFTAKWAHDAPHERRMFEDFVDFLIERFEACPNMHVYHYAPYETGAMKRLMSRYGTREDEVDRLLRAGVFVDLYRVVTQALRISEESYSIKRLEQFYGFDRDDDIAEGGSSLVEYERYLQTQDQAILDRIQIYNEGDCRSLVGLRDWLERLRVEAEAKWGALNRPPLLNGALPNESEEEREEVRALIEALRSGLPEDPIGYSDEDRARLLIADLLGWHRREEKSDWWAYYDRQAHTASELLDDREVLAVLTFEEIDGAVARSDLYRYSFLDQESKIDEGDKVHDVHTGKSAGTVWKVDYAERKVWLKRGRGWTGSHPDTIGPGQPVRSRTMQLALQELAGAVIEVGPVGAGRFTAARQLLLRSAPAISGHGPSDPMISVGELPKDAACRLVHSLQNSYLPIQGPPGTGKTYTGARMITSLLSAGKKVGITANSHKVISNLLDAVCEGAVQDGVKVKALQKCDQGEGSPNSMVECTSDNATFEAGVVESEYQLCAGTAWAISRPALQEQLDVLFIDEAGQFSLANTLAVATSALNVVLLGDPQQLNQPTKGIHPEGADTSALGHVLNDQDTISPEQGLFLEGTYRMHPQVTAYISDAFYEGRVSSQAGCELQVVDGDLGPGIHLVEVPHEGNRIFASEEIATIDTMVRGLLGSEWTDAFGGRRKLSPNDLLVVAPFNAQVARLRNRLPSGVPVGTVDKFQGQEGVVTFYSLTTSTPEDIPRNFEFLYSRNRLNVAVSRARSLAVVVCSPAMLLPMCEKPEHMRLANALCLLGEHSISTS